MRHMSTAPRCPRCTSRPALCLCERLPSIRTSARVSLLLHKVERFKSTNTGQLALACLDNADGRHQTFVYGNDLDDPPDRPWLEGAVPLVLFPVAGALPIERFRGVDGVTLIVLDAAWRQANRLRKRFALQRVPFVTVPVAPSVYKLRAEDDPASAHDGPVSTLEAIARALALLEGDPTIEARMVDVLRAFQDRTLWLRGALRKEHVHGGIPDGVLRHAPDAATTDAVDVIPTPLDS